MDNKLNEDIIEKG